MPSHDAIALPTDDELLRIARIAELVRRVREVLPGEPCLAHLRVTSGARDRDYLLGVRTVLDRDVAILDWQTAPLAGVFFAHEEGEDYELEIEDRAGDVRLIEGRVVERHLLSFDGGELSAVDGTIGRWARSPEMEAGEWRRVARDERHRLQPRLPARRRSPLEVPLDEVQRAAVTLPSGGALLVTGEAGAGKTTVALHRLAWLEQRAREQSGAPLRALVVVPTEGLRRLSERLLARLGVDTAEVVRYDRWASRLARRAFPGLPSRLSLDPELPVVRMKRHRALRIALAQLAHAGADTHALDALDEDGPRAAPPRVSRDDLLQLFGDRALLEEVVEASAGSVPRRDIERVAEHTRAQFRLRAEVEFADVVDAQRLHTTDGRAIDAGTPDDAAGRIDAEDFAVLFELDRLRAHALGLPTPPLPNVYDVVLIDEAQEVAPLELALLGRALAPGGTLIVAGDAGQQVDETVCFLDWTTTMRDLGARAHGITVLETSYRCPPAVTALARHVLDPADSRAQHEPFAEGERAVAFWRAESECHLVARVIDALRAMQRDDDSATAAVISRTPEAAARMARLLGRALDVRLSDDGDFDLGARLHVSCVREVRGLEFDYVLLPEVSTAVYPDDGEARRGLYVAITRAAEQLVLGSVATWSPLVRSVSASRAR